MSNYLPNITFSVVVSSEDMPSFYTTKKKTDYFFSFLQFSFLIWISVNDIHSDKEKKFFFFFVNMYPHPTNFNNNFVYNILYLLKKKDS